MNEPDMSPEDQARFVAKVKLEGECWLWTAALNASGYGQFNVNAKGYVAHRIAYRHWIGPIPKELQLDHLCRNRKCVRPSHLEPVTVRENILRGEGAAALNARKTHCKYGHAFTPENTGSHGGGRYCRTCSRSDWRKWSERQKVRAAA